MSKTRLTEIYKRLHREGYLWARQCCSYNDDHAKEIMQLVYLKILEGKAEYSNRAALKTWFFSVIRYTAIDFVNDQNKHVQMDIGQENIHANEEIAAPETNYVHLLAQLPDRQHQVLLLCFYHDLTLAEISQVLNISLGSVRTHYDRGKKKLKSILIKQQAQWQRMIN